MEQFCFSLRDGVIGSVLHSVLKSGDGAQERFRTMVTQYHLGKEWYTFKREAFYRTAIDWCRKNNLPFE